MKPKNKTIILTPDEIDKLLNACWIARENCTGESQGPYTALIEKLEDVQNGGEIVRALRDGSTACADCPHYGEPCGCNRPDGTCDAWGLGQDAASLIESPQAEIEKWRERHNQAALNFQQENRENQKLQAQLAESQRRERAAVEDLRTKADCTTCKNITQKPGHGSCDNCGIDYNGWQWRGVQEGERDE